MQPNIRGKIVLVLWVVTVAGLCVGYFDRRVWQWTVWFSAAHAALVLALVRGRPLVFPAQLRIAYTGWIALGTYVPFLEPMLWIATAGGIALLAFDYCPMARTLYLLPWNREEPFSLDMLIRTVISPPRPGRFDGGRGQEESA